MKPLAHEKIHFVVAKEIENYITANNLKSGALLPSEKQFADSLQIGRSSVREGLRLLEGMGMVRAVPGKGVFVDNTRETTITLQISVNRQSFLDVLVIRETLEIKAAQLAMEHATPEDLARIQAAYAAMDAQYRAGVIAHEEDLDFHISVYQACHNSYLKDLLESIIYIFFKAWPLPYGTDAAFVDTYDCHKELMDAILEKDVTKATDTIRRIIARSVRSVNEQIAP